MVYIYKHVGRKKNNNSGGGGDLMKQLREKQINVHDLEATMQLVVMQGRQREIWRCRGGGILLKRLEVAAAAAARPPSTDQPARCSVT